MTSGSEIAYPAGPVANKLTLWPVDDGRAMAWTQVTPSRAADGP
jgi:hypothetical protein